MIKWLVTKLIGLCVRFNRVQNITGRDNEDIYMVRYILFRSNFFSIYIHQFLRSDKDSYHDHPWNFWTFIVSNTYTEHTPWLSKDGKVIGDKELTRDVFTNRLLHRKAEQLHWVELRRSYSFNDRFDAPTTVCLIGRRRRAWGFLDKETEQWVFWKKYLGIPYDNEDSSPTHE